MSWPSIAWSLTRQIWPGVRASEDNRMTAVSAEPQEPGVDADDRRAACQGGVQVLLGAASDGSAEADHA